MSHIKRVSVKNVAGTQINPATEEKQDAQETTLNSIQVATEIMDDWDEANRAKVNVIVGQAGIAAGTGVDGATVPRVSLATDVALPAGTNNIGDVNILNVANSAINPATEEKQDALSTKVGEVQDTPTNHTILSRIKDVSDLLFAMWTFGLKVLNASNVVINPATSEIQTDGTQKTQIAGSNDLTRGAETDVLANYFITIPASHHQIHEGIDFYFCGQATLGVSGKQDFIFVTPNTTKWIHLDKAGLARSSASANLSIYEGVTADADGTAQGSVNSNRNSATTSDLIITHTPTNPVGTTLIYAEHWGSGKNTGGSSSGRNELILKQNTRYYIVINSEAASNDISWCPSWYEHTNV